MTVNTHSKLIELIDSIPEIRKAFKTTDIKGLPRTESIYNEPIFISWSENVKSELRKLKQDELIKEIYALFDKFTGWTDKRLFELLAAKLNIIKENYSNHLTTEDTTSDITTDPPTANITNYNFYGSMDGSNITTGDYAEQEIKPTVHKEKTWMEKYGIKIIVAVIGALATVGAALLTWWLTNG